MKSIKRVFEEQLIKMESRDWDHIYVVVDMHDTVFNATYANEDDLVFCSTYTKPALQLLSLCESIKLIYWSSTNFQERERHLEYLKKFGIKFDHVNGNPDEKSNEYANFSEKFYMNVILDDKAGFEPSDWEEVKKVARLTLENEFSKKVLKVKNIDLTLEYELSKK